MARTDFSTQIDIRAPAERVWAVMSDVERWPEWTPSVKRVRRLDGGPFGVGSRVLIRQPRLPPAFWRVTELEPERGFTWTSTAPGILVIGSHSVVPAEEGCRVTLSIRYRGLLGPLLARLTGSVNERYIRYEAEGLKRRSESGAA